MSEPKMTDLARQDAEELTEEQAEDAAGGAIYMKVEGSTAPDPPARGGTVIVAD